MKHLIDAHNRKVVPLNNNHILTLICFQVSDKLIPMNMILISKEKCNIIHLFQHF